MRLYIEDYCVQDRQASPFTEGEGIRDYDADSGIVYTHAYKALDSLLDWLEAKQNDLPFFDHAALFTGSV
jgi:hypothetical protein